MEGGLTTRGRIRAALALVAGVVAVPSGAASQSRAEPAFTVYGMSDGLSSAAVTALLQDSSGFLWIGTQDGLNRFDGTGFKAYRHRPGDSTSLRDDYVLSLALADSGRIWIGTQQGGLLRFDPLTEEVQSFPLTELGAWALDPSDGSEGQRVGRTVTRILVRPSGDLLLITDVGLVRFSSASAGAEILRPPAGSASTGAHATALSDGPAGHALVGLSDGSLALVDEEGGPSPLPFALPDSAASLAPSPRGYWAGTSGGTLYLIDHDLTTAREVLRLPGDVSDRVARGVFPAPDGSLWWATTGLAFLVDPTTASAFRVGDAGGSRALPDREVSQILMDRTGVLWFGTWGGLASLHPLATRISRVTAEEDLQGHGVITIADARDGGSWLGSYGGGVLHLDRGQGARQYRITQPPALAPLDRGLVFGVATEADGTLWVAGFLQGLWRLSPGGSAARVPIVGSRGPIEKFTAYSVFVDHAGEVWAGTDPTGLVRLDRSEDHFVPFVSADSAWDLGSNWVWPLAEDSLGQLWVGAYNGGLSVLSRDRSTGRRYPVGREGLSSGRILTLAVDSHDRVWVGTEGDGLSRFDPATGKFTLWTTEDGLPHDNVEGIVEDDAGLIWITTADGLARMDPESGEILVFREPAGLAGNRFLANGAHRGPDGTLYFGGQAGLTIVDPTAIASMGTIPNVALTAFRIQGRDAPLARAVRTNELVLAPDENFFAFEFAAMDFADVSQNRYRYMLEGLDADWVDAGNTPVANYTSVPPDRYVFRVEARNSEGIWNKNALALPIRVLAPYYEQWWFRSLVMVAVLSMVAGFYTYRLRQVEARQRLRLEIAGKLHDDIGANLSNIALKADMVRTSSALDHRRAVILGDVGRLARDTAHKVRETVWVVNTRYDTLPKLVGHMHDTADTLLSGHVAYGFTAPEDLPDQPLSMGFRQNVYLLFKEALNNAVKHASASRVDITVSFSSRTLWLRVVDDGVGFDPADARDGNGQQLMHTRATDARGRLTVQSAPGRGTTVEFSARVR